MKYESTRGGSVVDSTYECILKGLADDGGLYMPEHINAMDMDYDRLTALSYKELFVEVVSKIFDDIEADTLKEITEKAYDDKFKLKEKVGFKFIEDKCFLELYHGKTQAFKDFALSFLPQITKVAKEKLNINTETAVLVATSGDTGKAAMEGFSNVEGTKVVVLYPKDGVSEIQRYQMITAEGKNLRAIGIKGNFDNAQSALKEIFEDKELKEYFKSKNISLSSANSINIGRLVPQVPYYFYGYLELARKGMIKPGEKINIVVPTGNFGNILAAYIARDMGLPVNKLIPASNENNVITDFINTGRYNADRELLVTNSPSMDILVSSNLERLLYLLSGRDANKTKALMKDLKERKEYTVDEKIRAGLKDFASYSLNDEETIQIISKYYKDYGYLMDTHTAVGAGALEKYRRDAKDDGIALIASTASPYKFPKAVAKALSIDTKGLSDFEILNEMEKVTGVPIPAELKNLDSRAITQNYVSGVDEIREKIIGVL